MKKFIVALAAVAMTFGFTAMADVCNQQCEPNGNCARPCDSKNKKSCTAPCVFDDLNLTDAQKQQLKQLKDSQLQACKEARQANKQARKDARTNCRRDELAKIKSILTADQYVKFLENSYVQKGNGAPKKFDKNMKRGNMQVRKGDCRNACDKAAAGNATVPAKK